MSKRRQKSSKPKEPEANFSQRARVCVSVFFLLTLWLLNEWIWRLMIIYDNAIIYLLTICHSLNWKWWIKWQRQMPEWLPEDALYWVQHFCKNRCYFEFIDKNKLSWKTISHLRSMEQLQAVNLAGTKHCRCVTGFCEKKSQILIQ